MVIMDKYIEDSVNMITYSVRERMTQRLLAWDTRYEELLPNKIRNSAIRVGCVGKIRSLVLDILVWDAYYILKPRYRIDNCKYKSRVGERSLS